MAKRRNTSANTWLWLNKPLHKGIAEGLSKEFDSNIKNRQHAKVVSTIDYYGDEVKAEVHWFQEETVGKVKFKIKRWIYED